MNAPASPLAFDKIVGTGNDFLFFDLRERPLSEFTRLSRGELAIRAADRHNGVGADGVVFVERNEGEPALKWDFFNSDGSQAAMCGNALRCMGLWAREWLRSETVRFLTARGPIDVSHVEGEFTPNSRFCGWSPGRSRIRPTVAGIERFSSIPASLTSSSSWIRSTTSRPARPTSARCVSTPRSAKAAPT